MEEESLDLPSESYEEIIVLLTEASESDDIKDKQRKRDRRLDEVTDLRESIPILGQGKWEAFLRLPVIQNKFEPAFMLLEASGVGKKLWKLLWQEKLVINGPMKMGRNKCIACFNEKSPGYRLSEKRMINGVEQITSLGYIGQHCFDSCFNPLKQLVDHCLLLPLYIGDDMVDRTLTVYLNDIVFAVENMRDAKRAKIDSS